MIRYCFCGSFTKANNTAPITKEGTNPKIPNSALPVNVTTIVIMNGPKIAENFAKISKKPKNSFVSSLLGIKIE